jgi:predicted TIM-barrel fold metal-dependent hydrolase
MHLHAMAANSQGPPPLAMCMPITTMPTWSQQPPYAEELMGLFKKPPCADPIWSPATDAELMTQTIEAVKRLNVFGVLSGRIDRVDAWMAAAPDRFIPGVIFNLADGSSISAETMRERHAQGKLRVLGEVSNQYSGVVPAETAMEPYWKVAAELDIPVGYHMGPGPPGAIYLGFRGQRARLHSPLLLEEVLVRYPRLRVYVMHAGFPMLDDMLAMLYQHPQLHVDVGVIVYTQPRPAFYRYLQAIVDAGFAGRVMFGSDQMVWPGAIERSIEVINAAPFLSAAQKRDILYNNAARFLRLSTEEMARHRLQ